MMGEVKVNYDSLLASAPVLETEAELSKKEIEELPDIRESIIQIGKSHDNCFSNISDEMEINLNNVLTEITNLSSDIVTTVNTFSQAELALIDSIKINSIGLDNAIKYQHTKTYETSLTGYDYEYYQELLNKALNLAKTTRAKSTMAAIFLSTTFPHMNYFWGGGHDKISEGLDPTWGTPKVVTAAGSDTTGTEQPNSLDCSGYISWSLKNGGYDISKPMVTGELEQLGEKIPITGSAEKNIQVGDLAYMDGHVGMIIRKYGTEITVSHCSGSGNGMNITKIDTTTGLVTEDYSNASKDRIGNPYFTDIIKLNYKD